MNRYLKAFVVVWLAQVDGIPFAAAQGQPAASQAQQVLSAAAAEQKYTFLVFYKANDPATQAMAKTVERGVESRSERAKIAYVNITDPTETALVDRFDVSRAPMPLTVALAPNGAMTSAAPKSISDEQIGQAFVTPGMAYCMKSMQEGRLVFACFQSTAKAALPPSVEDFSEDPQFKGRVAAMLIQAGDPAEAQFLRQFEIDAAAKTPTIVFLAPPGVLIGKFGPTATKEQMAVALHKAGKCCDDPNCKLNQAGQPASQPTGASRQATQGQANKRN